MTAVSRIEDLRQLGRRGRGEEGSGLWWNANCRHGAISEGFFTTESQRSQRFTEDFCSQKSREIWEKRDLRDVSVLSVAPW